MFDSLSPGLISWMDLHGQGGFRLAQGEVRWILDEALVCRMEKADSLEPSPPRISYQSVFPPPSRLVPVETHAALYPLRAAYPCPEERFCEVSLFFFGFLSVGRPLPWRYVGFGGHFPR